MNAALFMSLCLGPTLGSLEHIHRVVKGRSGRGNSGEGTVRLVPAPTLQLSLARRTFLACHPKEAR